MAIDCHIPDGNAGIGCGCVVDGFAGQQSCASLLTAVLMIDCVEPSARVSSPARMEQSDPAGPRLTNIALQSRHNGSPGRLPGPPHTNSTSPCLKW